MNDAAQQPVVDVGALIDEGRWTTFQKLMSALVASAIVLDGFDNQVLGFALPAIIREWGVDRAAFAPVVALGLIGMAIGTALAGLLGDRFGRRPTLIGCMLFFACATGGIAFAQDLTTVGALRFLAGAGIGGALPNAAALTAEFTPARNRPVAVTCTIVCVPLGGIVGGLLAAQLLPTLGWRALFVVGGAAPIVLALVLALVLPESPRFLVRHPRRGAELVRLLRRCGRPTPENARFTDVAEQTAGERGGLGALFTSFYRRDTLALWVAFFFTQMAVYTAFSWVPTMLASYGLDLAAASSGLTAYNFGGVLGALSGAALISLYGSRGVMGVLSFGGVASAVLLIFVPLSPAGPHGMLVSMLGAHGFFVNAIQTTMYALAAHVYLTNVRSTGTGAALGVGRFGAILSSFVGAAALGFGATAYYQILAVAMTGAMVGLLVVRRHIPPSREEPRPAAQPMR